MAKHYARGVSFEHVAPLPVMAQARTSEEGDVGALGHGVGPGAATLQRCCPCTWGQTPAHRVPGLHIGTEHGSYHRNSKARQHPSEPSDSRPRGHRMMCIQYTALTHLGSRVGEAADLAARARGDGAGSADHGGARHGQSAPELRSIL